MSSIFKLSVTACAFHQYRWQSTHFKKHNIIPMSLASKYLGGERHTHSKIMIKNKLNIYIPIKISATYQKIFQ